MNGMKMKYLTPNQKRKKCAKTNIAKQRIVPVTPANVPKNNVATATRMLGEITGKFLVLPCNPILTYYT